MKQQTEATKFAHLQYEVLHTLEISINEYWFLDMVYQLSRSGWCYKSLESIANDMRLTKNGVVKLRDRLIERGLINKDRRGRLNTSVTYNSVYRVNPTTYNSVQNRTTKYNATVQLSGTKINNETNIDKSEVKESEESNNGYLNALTARNALNIRMVLPHSNNTSIL
jgi:predicted transcriptional regulator